MAMNADLFQIISPETLSSVLFQWYGANPIFPLWQNMRHNEPNCPMLSASTCALLLPICVPSRTIAGFSALSPSKRTGMSPRGKPCGIDARETIDFSVEISVIMSYFDKIIGGTI